MRECSAMPLVWRVADLKSGTFRPILIFLHFQMVGSLVSQALGDFNVIRYCIPFVIFSSSFKQIFFFLFCCIFRAFNSPKGALTSDGYFWVFIKSHNQSLISHY